MEERQVFDLPGTGEIRARVGTSTHSLAGAAKFWHDRSKRAWRDGFLSACVVLSMLSITVYLLLDIWF